jgi:rhodanese-related sulfurtransferase
MTLYREPEKKRVFAEMAVIFLIAAAVGIAWNQKLLRQAWTGNAPVSAPLVPAAPLQGNIPLPLGLLQVKELHERREALFVDARDESAFATGHIAGAVSLPFGKTEMALAKFRRDVPGEQPLVVYCSGYDCHDSRDLATRLLKAGYRTVYVYEGGSPEWRDAGYPLEGGKQ